MVEFAPMPGGELLVAVADKDGNVGLWDVDKVETINVSNPTRVDFRAIYCFSQVLALFPLNNF
eukprot:scaffold190201_cov14-Prasinocladus_malaysianus.AAC.1